MSLGANKSDVLAARMQGVRVATDGTGTSNRGTPQRVTHVYEGKTVFVGYNDEQGRACVALYFQVGDQFYAPKDTVSWCANLFPMVDWIKEGVLAKLEQKAPADVATLPDSDAVDILGGFPSGEAASED